MWNVSMAKRLTETGLERIRRRSKTFFLWDSTTTGLGVKVTAAGRKIFVLQSYFGSDVQSRQTLGRYPQMRLSEAREKAARWRAWAREGADPRELEAEQAAERQAERQVKAARRRNTFRAYAESFIAGRTNRHAAQDARELRRLAIAQWADRPISEIRPKDVRQLIDRVKRRAPRDARNLWGLLSVLFKQATHEEVISVSPLASLDKRLALAGIDLRPRQRVLDDDELQAFWLATGQIEFPARQVYRLLGLTGARHSEIAKLRWQELPAELRRSLREKDDVDWSKVDDRIKIARVPAERFKSGVEHVIQLSDAACQVLAEVPRSRGDFVFSLNGSNPAWIGGKHKRRLDAGMVSHLRELAKAHGEEKDKVELRHWVPHDLRRVMRSHLSALNVDAAVAELVLGHGKRGLIAVYDRYQPAAEIRRALEAWSGRLREIVNRPPIATNNVVETGEARAFAL